MIRPERASSIAAAPERGSLEGRIEALLRSSRSPGCRHPTLV
jgi:hypothetical protein